MISAKPALKGVWRVKEGGWLLRARVKDRAGVQRLIFRVLPGGTADEARALLAVEMARVRTGAVERTVPSFADYAISLAERKVREGTVRAAHSREVMTSILQHHLLPVFGGFRVDQMRRADVLAWKDDVARRIEGGGLSPHTANGWFSLLRSTIKAAVAEYELERNPITGVKPFNTSQHPTYTHEEPNSLTADEARVFLATLAKRFPQFYAMTVLGFATGLRPSSLRPLRRHGPQADVLWEQGALLVRQSHTRRVEVMNSTKTGGRQRIALPPELIDVLRAHIDALPEGPMAKSDLLFPSVRGRFRAPSVLDKPFRAVASAMGLGKKLTPRGMRRTFQDLCRAAEVKDVVTRSISGHTTEDMQRHYSTASEAEQRDGMAKVLYITGIARPPAPPQPSAARAAGG